MKNQKSTLLFIILGGFFIANAIIAEFIGVKIFSLEKFFGFDPVNLTLFGESGLSFNLTAGVLLWPVVFIMTDIINEYYGVEGVRILSYLAAGLILYAFIMVYFAIGLPSADFWVGVNAANGVPDMNSAYRTIFGQGLWIIIGSLIAFLLGQFIDVYIFHFLKSKTGEGSLWFRSTGSTVVSQFIDSFVVLFIAFYVGANWSFAFVMAICIVNYIYKFSMALLLTPVIYFVHEVIEKYLGHELAESMKNEAMGNS